MNRQEIFDKVVDRLRDGTGRAVNYNNGSCSYKNEDGLMCAVGIFLDHKKFPRHISHSVPFIVGEEGLPSFIEEQVGFFERIQILHDEVVHWEGNKFKENVLIAFANRHDLELKPIENEPNTIDELTTQIGLENHIAFIKKDEISIGSSYYNQTTSLSHEEIATLYDQMMKYKQKLAKLNK